MASGGKANFIKGMAGFIFAILFVANAHAADFLRDSHGEILVKSDALSSIPTTLSTDISPKSKSEDGKIPDWPDFAIAISAVATGIFTAVLAVSTILLWRATERLWKTADRELVHLTESVAAAKTAADAAVAIASLNERVFETIERPYLLIHFVSEDDVDPMKLSGPDAVGFYFENHGRTPAIVTWVYRVLTVTKTIPLPMIHDDSHGYAVRHGIIVKPGGRSEVFGWSDFELLQMDRDSKHVSIKKYFMGFVRYKDFFEVKYIHGFCHEYNYDRKNFRISGPISDDGKYNFTRRDLDSV